MRAGLGNFPRTAFLEPLHSAAVIDVFAQERTSQTRARQRVFRVNGIKMRSNRSQGESLRAAIGICQRLVTRSDVRERLQRDDTTIIIIPRDKKITDFDEFADLRGKKTPDGRDWSTVRGGGGDLCEPGKISIGIGEECLDGTSTYAKNFSVGMHELAHVVMRFGVTDTERNAIAACYAGRKKNDGPWTDAYAASSADEYFAQATTAYFGKHQSESCNASWLTKNDALLFALLKKIYTA